MKGGFLEKLCECVLNGRAFSVMLSLTVLLIQAEHILKTIN